MKYTVLLFPGGGGWITAVVPALPGCVSQGRTTDKALKNVQEAITGWLDAWHENPRHRPPKESLRDILNATRQALEVQQEIRKEDAEDVEVSLELRTVTVPLQAAA